AGQADLHPVAVLDHLILDDGGRRLLREARLELGSVAHRVILCGVRLIPLVVSPWTRSVESRSQDERCPSRDDTTLAGTPTAIADAGTLSRTTAPAPITAWSPSATPSRIFAPAPIQTPSPIVTPADVRDCASTGVDGSE